MLNIKLVIEEHIVGDFAKLGVNLGNTAAILAHYVYIHNRHVFLFDTFNGFDGRDLKGVDAKINHKFAYTSIETAKDVIGIPEIDNCSFVKGYFPDSLGMEHEDRTFNS